MQEITYDQFVVHLRSALHYLYDPVHLRSSRLVELLRLTDEFDRAAALQQTLTQAIRSLKPVADEPPQSRAWRAYDILNFLYIRQMERDAVATQLGMSERQLRREQRVALEVLAHQVWSQIAYSAPAVHTAPTQSDKQPTQEVAQALSDELIWLKIAGAELRIPLDKAMHTVQSLAQPLAQQWQASLQVDIAPDYAELAVAPMALRSILLTILSIAIPRAVHGQVIISAAYQSHEIELTVTCRNRSMAHMPFSEKDAVALQTAQNLATFYKAGLAFLNQEGECFTATLTLPLPEQIPVLVIDDNADWIELLQRVAVGSRYHVTGSSDPEQAHKLAEQMQPAAIILDVMMHNIDGWQVLSELRHQPATARIPVIVCTILPVEDLALSLGANAFLQKPVTQQRFLQTLNEQLILAK